MHLNIKEPAVEFLPVLAFDSLEQALVQGIPTVNIRFSKILFHD
jgi:hypothetical protein